MEVRLPLASHEKKANPRSAKNMRQHYINLENNHQVAKGTPGHGFEGFLDITVNTPELLQNQSNAITVLKAAAKAVRTLFNFEV